MTQARSAIGVSVIIPVYNGAEFLAQQLDALTRQDFSGAWELVVVDNNSTDESVRIAETYSDRLPLRIERAVAAKGAAYARNAGADSALGELLVYCDADDIVADNWLAAIVAASRDFDLVGGVLDATTLNPPEILQARGRQQPDTQLPMGPGGFLPYAVSANFAISRAVLRDLGGWDAEHAEDVDLSWRAQLAGHRLGFAADAVVNYRFRPDLGSLYRQIVAYTDAEVDLYRLYRDRGARRRSGVEFLGTLWWLVSRLPFIAGNRERRYTWVAVAGGQLGRIKGSLRGRVRYL